MAWFKIWSRRLSLALPLTALTTPQAEADDRFGPALPVDQTAAYKTTDRGDLNLYFFLPEGHTPDAATPAVLFFFGGGWNGGTPLQFQHQARHLADRGIVGITADYRTKKSHGVSPFECVADAIEAMRYLRAHADELGLDPERLGAGGGSAGGHLAVSLSTVTAEWLIPRPDDPTGFRPDALVLFNPVYDNSPAPAGYGHDRVGEKFRDFSPAHNLHAEMPPTLVLLGDRDPIIPVATAERVRDEMTDLGVRSELIVYPGQRHGFFNYRRGQPDNEMLRDTTRNMDDFLVSLGWLEPR